MIRKINVGLSIVLVSLALSACADTFVTSQPQPSSTTLLRDYDKTLSKSQQQAVIGEMKAEAKATGGATAKSSEN